MNICIAYSSFSGNTKRLAEALLSVAPKGTKMFDLLGEDVEGGHFDVIALGYWVYNGSLDPQSAKFLSTLHKRRIFLFGTCGAEPGTPYCDKVKSTVREAISSDNSLIGEYLCLGEISKELMHRWYEELHTHPENEHARVQIENYEKSKDFPKEKELEEAKALFLQALKDFSK